MASLKNVTEEFIHKKGRHEVIKTQSNKNTIKHINTKKRQNIYISENTVKLLWQHRIDSGETISHTIERLVLDQLAKKK